MRELPEVGDGDTVVLAQRIHLETGMIRGAPRNSRGVLAFKGIPYAAPPRATCNGALRDLRVASQRFKAIPNTSRRAAKIVLH